jgi:hypothetical protein
MPVMWCFRELGRGFSEGDGESMAVGGTPKPVPSFEDRQSNASTAPLVMSRVVTLLESLQTLVTLQGTSQSQHFEWMNGRVGHFAGEAIVCGEEISAHQHAP